MIGLAVAVMSRPGQRSLPVSYTNPTLPTISRVWRYCDPSPLKKKKKHNTNNNDNNTNQIIK
ncbi:hypothetical protein, partial [Bradyrhizobium canariense]|uniref:hypothetical protein n=1 Tax=Bradyrhizobium canariense TaxID=255045 RepID=UPI001AECFF50